MQNNGGQIRVKLCRVCGTKASGFNYGGLSCEKCKIFFLRNYNKLKVCMFEKWLKVLANNVFSFLSNKRILPASKRATTAPSTPVPEGAALVVD